MIYGNLFLKEEYGYKSKDNEVLNEGLLDLLAKTSVDIGKKIHKIINRPNTKNHPAKGQKTTNFNPEDINIIFKKASSSDMKNLYNIDGLSFEGLDLSSIKNDESMKKLINRFYNAGVLLNNNCTIYVCTGKDVNKTYDLEGDNRYPDNYHISIISFKDFKLMDPTNYDAVSNMKQSLGCRYWRDVVDNNEYREYIKGRHKATAQIQWLIDAYKNQ